MPDWLLSVPGIDPNCAHEWNTFDTERSCIQCLQFESLSQDIVLMPPEMTCPRCSAVIPNNLVRDIEDKRAAVRSTDDAVLPGCEPEPDEFAVTHRNLSYLGCPACALAAMPMPVKIKRPKDDSQMSIEAPEIEIL